MKTKILTVLLLINFLAFWPVILSEARAPNIMMEVSLLSCGAGGSTPTPTTCLMNDHRCYAVGISETTDEWGGGYAAWKMRKYPAPKDVSSSGHTNHTLWASTDNKNIIGAWLEVGYTKGFEGANIETYYWARQDKNGNYSHARVTSLTPGAEGTNHTYEVQAYSPTNYKGYIDFTEVVSVNQSGWTKMVEVGLETTDDNSNVGHTYPTAMSYREKDTVTWHNWYSGRGVSEDPYRWEFLNSTFYKGHNWNKNYVTLNIQPINLCSGRPSLDYESPPVIYEATGGPYISQNQALSEAGRIAASFGNNNSLREDLRLTTYGQARSWTTNKEAKSAEVDDSREVWLVTLKGPVTMPFKSPSAELKEYKYVQIFIDASTGEAIQVATGLGDWPSSLN